jgi:hypothetical protein
VSLDAISEFSIETAGSKAEYGRANGVINFVTKSGTNEFHGSVYEYMRNEALDARGFFASTRPKLRQHDFGGTLGGPVSVPKLYDGRNKTFFFFNYEGFRNREGAQPSFSTVPFPEMYQGDFRGLSFSETSSARTPHAGIGKIRCGHRSFDLHAPGVGWDPVLPGVSELELRATTPASVG